MSDLGFGILSTNSIPNPKSEIEKALSAEFKKEKIIMFEQEGDFSTIGIIIFAFISVFFIVAWVIA